jgi:hypothetical protein
MLTTIYRGHVCSDDLHVIEVVRDGAPIGYALPHRVRHSPTGLSWGYGGSGPADTARSILADHLGWVPHPAVYQQFKEDIVARLPPTWSLTSDDIAATVSRIAVALAVSCVRCCDEGITDAERDDARVIVGEPCHCAMGRAWLTDAAAVPQGNH